jgi:hypothetical protein
MGIRHASDLRLSASPQVNAGLTAVVERVCSDRWPPLKQQEKGKGHWAGGIFGTNGGWARNHHENQIHEISGQVALRRVSVRPAAGFRC